MKTRLLYSVLALLALPSTPHMDAQDSPAARQSPVLPQSIPKSAPPQTNSAPVLALHVVDFKKLTSTTGWVSTGNRILMTTADGAHWKDISPPVPGAANPNRARFSGVCFLDADTGWALSVDSTASSEDYGSTPIQANPLYLSLTTDGGTTWEKVNLPGRKFSESDMGMSGGMIAFADRLHGWLSMRIMSTMLYHGSVLFATSDGGRTWTPTKGGAPGTEALLALTEKDLWAVGTTVGAT